MDEYKELFLKSVIGFSPLLVTVGLVSIKPFEVRAAMFDSWFRWVILAAAIWTAFGFLWCIDTVVDIIRMEFKYLVIRTIGRSGNKYIREIAYSWNRCCCPNQGRNFMNAVTRPEAAIPTRPTRCATWDSDTHTEGVAGKIIGKPISGMRPHTSTG